MLLGRLGEQNAVLAQGLHAVIGREPDITQP